jgi:hypothetical protein
VDFEYFATRGFGTDHLYYRAVIGADNLIQAFAIYISEGASEPLSLIYFYVISLLPLDSDWKFDLARIIMYFLIIWNFRRQTFPLLFITIIYFNPLMFTMFQSNLRQALAFSLLVYLLTLRFRHMAFLLATMAHSSVIIVYAVLNYRYTILTALVTVGLLIGIIFAADNNEYLLQWSNVAYSKINSRILVTEIQDLGFLIHLSFILIIYLSMNQRNLRVKRSSVLVSLSIFTLFICLMFFNNIAQRLVVYVWLLPIMKLHSYNDRDISTKTNLPLLIMALYTLLLWMKTLTL